MGHVMTYEYPFNETVRSLLRLEYLFRRFEIFANSPEPEHHLTAITLLFELAEVTSRADLKLSVLKELERQKNLLISLRSEKSVNPTLLDQTISEIELSWQNINQIVGKPNAAINESDWLNSVRSRISVPGGTSPVDLPSFYNWQQIPFNTRRDQLIGYTLPFAPWQVACSLYLRLLRQSGESQEALAPNGSYQQMLAGRTYQLIRVDISDQNIIPEISANKHMLWIRFLQVEHNGKPHPLNADLKFNLTLCNL
jgi:cell division protein ZapD